jgi:hypothetical protein
VDFISSFDVIKRFHDEKWDKQNPQDGDFVRGRHGAENLPRICGFARTLEDQPIE